MPSLFIATIYHVWRAQNELKYQGKPTGWKSIAYIINDQTRQCVLYLVKQSQTYRKYIDLVLTHWFITPCTCKSWFHLMNSYFVKYIYVCIYVCMYVWKCVYIDTHTYTHTHVHTCTYTSIYIYIHTHILFFLPRIPQLWRGGKKRVT